MQTTDTAHRRGSFARRARTRSASGCAPCAFASPRHPSIQWVAACPSFPLLNPPFSSLRPPPRSLPAPFIPFLRPSPLGSDDRALRRGLGHLGLPRARRGVPSETMLHKRWREVEEAELRHRVEAMVARKPQRVGGSSTAAAGRTREDRY